jgi:hypothetical protein
MFTPAYVLVLVLVLESAGSRTRTRTRTIRGPAPTPIPDACAKTNGGFPYNPAAAGLFSEAHEPQGCLDEDLRLGSTTALRTGLRRASLASMPR